MRTTKVHQHTKKWQIILWERVVPKHQQVDHDNQ
jgi:hypothetical protein